MVSDQLNRLLSNGGISNLHGHISPESLGTSCIQPIFYFVRSSHHFEAESVSKLFEVTLIIRCRQPANRFQRLLLKLVDPVGRVLDWQFSKFCILEFFSFSYLKPSWAATTSAGSQPRKMRMSGIFENFRLFWRSSPKSDLYRLAHPDYYPVTTHVVTSKKISKKDLCGLDFKSRLTGRPVKRKKTE